MRIKPIRQSVQPTMASRVRAPRDLTSGFAQGLGQMGRALEGAGLVGLEIAGRVKYFEDSVALTEITNQAKLELADHNEYIQGLDSRDISEDGKLNLELVGKRLADSAGNINQEVAARWKPIWENFSAESQIQTNRIRIDKLRQSTIGGLINFSNIAVDEAVKAQTKEEADAILAKLNDAADLAQQEFMLSGQWVENFKQGARKSYEAKVRAADKAAKDAQEKMAITGAYANLRLEAWDHDNDKMDYPKAQNLLKKPGKYGLTIQQAEQLSNILDSQQAREKEETEKEQKTQRAVIQRAVVDGSASVDQINATSLDPKEKLFWIEKHEARTKAIIDGEKDPLNVTDQGVRARLSELALVNPDDLTELGGVSYIWDYVGKGLSIKDAEHISGLYEKRDKGDLDEPLLSSGFKNSVKTLDLARKNLMFIEKTLDDDLTNEEQLENQYNYGTAYTDLENRVQDGEDPQEALKAVMEPFVDKKARSWFGQFVDLVGQYYQTTPPYQEIIEGKPQPKPDQAKRQRAIKILTDAGKQVDEETIGKVMEQLP